MVLAALLAALHIAQLLLVHMQSKQLQLLFDAMHHGKYHFDDFLHADITSSYTSRKIQNRTVYRPDRKLKAYLIFLNAFVFEYLEVNKRVVYSYRKGVNPHDVVQLQARNRAFFQTDIKKFFGSIDRKIIKSTMLSQQESVPIPDLSAHIERILDLTTVHGSLPIGFHTSPHISNVCLTPFDDDFESHCLSSKLVYTRYADDIIVSGSSLEDLDGAEEKLNEFLQHHFSGMLKLNERKRKIRTVGRKVSILGKMILPNGQVTIDTKLRKRVEVYLYFYTRGRERFLDMFDGDIEAGINKLSGYINYINTADHPYLEKLKRKFGATVIDGLLHKSAQ